MVFQIKPQNCNMSGCQSSECLECFCWFKYIQRHLKLQVQKKVLQLDYLFQLIYTTTNHHALVDLLPICSSVTEGRIKPFIAVFLTLASS